MMQIILLAGVALLCADGDDAARSDLCSQLRARETAYPVWESTFVVEGSLITPHDQEHASSFTASNMFSFSQSDGSFRIDSLIDNTLMPGLTWNWDGRSAWITQSETRLVTISPEFKAPTELDCLFLFNCSPGPSIVGPVPISEIAKRGQLDQRRVEGDIEIWTFSLGRGRTRVQLGVHSNARGDIAWLCSEALDSGGSVKARREYRVLKWGSFEGSSMPEEAEFVTYMAGDSHPHLTQLGDQTRRLVYRRLTANRALTNQLVALPSACPIGTSVVDQRLSATYEFGGSSINYDGYEFRTTTPLDPLSAILLTREEMTPHQTHEHDATNSVTELVEAEKVSEFLWFRTLAYSFSVLMLLGLAASWKYRPQWRPTVVVIAVGCAGTGLITWCFQLERYRQVLCMRDHDQAAILWDLIPSVN